MQVIDADQVVTFDCDDTLVMWSKRHQKADRSNVLEFTDPYVTEKLYLVPHKEHVNLLKKYKARGFTVIVWSAGGCKWAEEVVRVLELAPYVDLVLTKPNRYVDDLPCKEWMGNRVYIPFKE